MKIGLFSELLCKLAQSIYVCKKKIERDEDDENAKNEGWEIFLEDSRYINGQSLAGACEILASLPLFGKFRERNKSKDINVRFL